MYIPKKYGMSKMVACPFCGKTSVTNNSQGVPVCTAHKDNELQDLKCLCGEYLDLLEGKWGPYFRCMNCGSINFKKGLEMNPQATQIKAPEPVEKKESYPQAQAPKQPTARKEITITSDDAEYFD